MKKRNLTISIIIAILVLILGTIIYINSNKLPTEPLDKDGILKLLAKVEDNDNICVETIYDSGHGIEYKTTMYKKDGIILVVTPNENDSRIAWENTNTGESIEVREDYKIWYNVKQNEDVEEYEQTFIKYEKYNNKKCAVIETIFPGIRENKDKQEELITTARMWIDLELGVTLKIEYTNNFGEEYASYSTVTLNKVKDKDVQKPNLEGYTEYKYEENLEESETKQ